MSTTFTAFFNSIGKTDLLIGILLMPFMIGLSQSNESVNFNDSIKKYRSLKPDMAMMFAQTWHLESKTESQKAKSLLWLGVLTCDISQYDSSELYLNKSLAVFQSLQDSISQADVYQALGETKENLGLYSASLDFYRHGFAIRKRKGTNSEIARSLNSIGNIYVFLSNYSLALENYLACLKISEAEKNEKEIANSFNNIGMVYDYTKDLDIALDYYGRALKAYEKLDDKRGLAGVLNNIGLIYKNKNQPDKSISYYQRSLTLFEELKSPYGVAALQNNLGVAHGLLKNQDLALKYHTQSLSTNLKIGNSDGIANSNNSIGEAYLKLTQFEAAEKYFSTALSIGQKIKAVDRMAESYEGLARAREGMNDFKKALQYFQSARVLQDTLYSSEKSQKLYEMEQKYESALKENQIALLNSETEKQKLDILQKNELINQRNIQLGLVGASLLLLGLVVYLFYSRLRIGQQAKLEVARIEKEQAIIKSIYEQRISIAKDMHDEIGSGLTHIALLSEVISSNKQTSAQLQSHIQTISNTSRNLVQSISEIIWAINPKQESLENLTTYIREQTHKYFEPFQVNYQINFPEHLPDLKLNNLQKRNLFLVTKEALNNALKYSKASQITLTLKLGEGTLAFEVKDNGQGFDSKNIQTNSNGLRNMKTRMTELGGSFDINGSSGTSVKYAMNLSELISP